VTKEKRQKIMALANDNSIDWLAVDYSILIGCGLPDFGKKYCTIKQVAALLRWQALQLNGEWDSEELDSIFKIAQKKFLVL